MLLPLAVSGGRDTTLDAAKDLRTELDVGEVTDGVQAYLVGQQALWAGMQVLQQEDLAKAEALGFPAILIVLLVVFGSLLAALLPVGLGVAAVVVTGAAVYFLALATTMSVFVTNIASMLGIGVAVDYSLFLLSRYREEVHKGADRAHALDAAMRTSGATVVFSGMTVLVSLAGLFLLNSTVMRSLAIGAMVVVAIAVLGAVTLLPALIALLGRRVEEPGRVVSATGALLRRLARRPKPTGRAAVLGALDGHRDAPAGAVGRARRDDPARAGDPGAVAGVRQRRAADVPGGSRGAARRRAGRRAGRARRVFAAADRRRLPARHASRTTRPRSIATWTGSRRRRAWRPSRSRRSRATAARCSLRVVQETDPESREALAVVDRLRAATTASTAWRRSTSAARARRRRTSTSSSPAGSGRSSCS